MVVALIWILQVILFIVGTVFAFKKRGRNNKVAILPIRIRVILSTSLVAAAFLIYLNSNQGFKTYTLYVLIGMVFSSIGDLILARIIKSKNKMLIGGSSFVCGHILYITAYILTMKENGLSFFNTGFILGFIVYLFFLSIGWIRYIKRKKFKAKVRLGLISYGLFIALMASTALSFAWSYGGLSIITAIGALSFLLSDSLIGIVDYGGASIKNRNILVWLTYIIGQMGIIYTPWLISYFK